VVVQHPDEAEARHPRAQFAGEVELRGRQRSQRRAVSFETLGAREVALPNELGEKPFVGTAVGKVVLAPVEF
jgi:hypothetical protein